MRPRRRGLFGDWVALIAPVLGTFSFSVGGQLPYTEILFFLALPFLLFFRPHKVFDKSYRIPYLLLGLWVFSQTITDVYVETSPASRVKGLARVLFFALDLAWVSAIIGTSIRRTKIFTFGLIGAFLRLTFPFNGDVGLEWKMTLGIATSITVLLAISGLYAKRKFVPVILATIILAALNLHYAARNAMVIDLAVASFLISESLTGQRMGPIRGKRGGWRLLVTLVLLGAAVWGSQQILKLAVQTGLFSEADQYKYEQQSNGKLGIIFGGRPEVLVAARAIIDSPIIGHGSYAVSYKYSQLLRLYMYDNGYSDSDASEDIENPIIPTHSHLTMCWVEAGLLASLFWFYMLYFIGRSMIRLTQVHHPLGPLYMYLLMTFTWDILFSPFGFNRRLFEAFLIVIMTNVLRSDSVSHLRPKSPNPVVRRTVVGDRRPGAVAPTMRPRPVRGGALGFRL